MRAILMYHSIDETGSPISIAPREFRRHVEWCASSAVQVLPLRELVAQRGAPAALHQVALTFDDGFANFATEALPLLQEYGLPSTVFVVSEHVGRSNRWADSVSAHVPELPLMPWDVVARVADAGVELGAHTRTHPHLSRVPVAQIEDELRGGVTDIAQHTGRRATTFAYPYGDRNAAAEHATRTLFACACTTDFRALRADDDSATLPRLDALYFREPGTLSDFGSPAFRARIAARRMARRVRRLVRAD